MNFMIRLEKLSASFSALIARPVINESGAVRGRVIENLTNFRRSFFWVPATSSISQRWLDWTRPNLDNHRSQSLQRSPLPFDAITHLYFDPRPEHFYARVLSCFVQRNCCSDIFTRTKLSWNVPTYIQLLTRHQ